MPYTVPSENHLRTVLKKTTTLISGSHCRLPELDSRGDRKGLFFLTCSQLWEPLDLRSLRLLGLSPALWFGNRFPGALEPVWSDLGKVQDEGEASGKAPQETGIIRRGPAEEGEAEAGPASALEMGSLTPKSKTQKHESQETCTAKEGQRRQKSFFVVSWLHQQLACPGPKEPHESPFW